VRSDLRSDATDLSLTFAAAAQGVLGFSCSVSPVTASRFSCAAGHAVFDLLVTILIDIRGSNSPNYK
jgi:hypothetical protein